MDHIIKNPNNEENITPKKKNSPKRKQKRKIFRWILLFLIICFISTAWIGWKQIEPEYKEIKESVYDSLTKMKKDTFIREGNTEIYDSEGNLIGRIGNEHYKYLEIDQIPETITKAYVAIEDRNFYTHHGVDIKGTLRAGIQLILNKGSITQGGSTITQQTVKNNLLTQEKIFKRKFTEMFLAWEMEKEFNKAKIMEFYCNSCYYGQNCYGIEGASQYYFGKSVKDLSLAESAMLVGISNSPNNYNPVTSYEKAIKRASIVLEAMFECGLITEEEKTEAQNERPEIVQKSVKVEYDSYQITYALHCAALELMKNDGFSFQYIFETKEDYKTYTEKYEESYSNALSTVRNGGYKIYTSLNTELQEKLQNAVDKGLSGFKSKADDGRYEMQGAAVCVDNDTQMVAAIVGGRGTEDQYNRGYQAERQPGSCIKPLLDYGPAINEGIVTAGYLMNDSKITVKGYTPKNMNNKQYGDVTIREAIARSINTIALKCLNMTGQDVCLSYLDKMKFSSLQYTDMNAPSISLGGFTTGVTVADMAKGYAAIACGGSYQDTNCILSLIDRTGKEVYQKEEDAVTVYSEDTAFILTDMLVGVFEEEYGTAHHMKNKKQVYAGKTGTTNDSKDAWFCGYSSYYTTVVWCGYDIPRTVEGLYGGSYPGTIWKNFMNEIHENKKKKEFSVPDTVCLQKGETQKKASYTSNIYESRPNGWDYVSSSIKDKIEAAEAERQEKTAQKAAEKAVKKYETYQIHSIEDAESADEPYEEAMSAVRNVGDLSVRSTLMERITAKRELLNQSLIDTWNDAIEESKQAEQDLLEAENVKKAQESLEKAEQIKKDSLIDRAEWYIEHLNQRTLYSDHTKKMITDGQTALDACFSLPEYSDLQNRFISAKSYAENLPTSLPTEPVEIPSEEEYAEPNENEFNQEDQGQETTAQESSIWNGFR